MKRINFKVLLIVVLSLVCLCGCTGCPEKDPTTTPPTVSPDNHISEYLTEVVEGLELTIDDLSELTDRFDANVEFYAVVNDVEYLISIKANVDLRDVVAATNASNKLAIEVSKEVNTVKEIVIGFYYNGAQDAFFLDIPSKNIKRYIDGFDLLTVIKDNTVPVTGGFASQIPNIELVSSVGDILDMIADFGVFSSVEKSVVGAVTTYDFTLSQDLISALLPLAGAALSDLDIDGTIDDLFGISGFSLEECTIPDFDLHIFADVTANKGLSRFELTLEVPAFNFYINDEETTEPIAVSAFNLAAGINLFIDAAGDNYTVNCEVPTTATAGYTYFSPLNVNTSGQFALQDEGGATFVVKTDINPFLVINDEKIASAKAFIDIKTWGDLEEVEDAESIFTLNIIAGDVYVMTNDEGVIKYYTLDIQQGITLIKEVIAGLDTLVLPESDGAATPDVMALVGLVTAVPDMIIDGKLTIDKAFIEEVIAALKIEDVELPEDLEITAWLNYDDVDTDKITGARAEAYLKEFDEYVMIGAEETYTGTKYIPATYTEDEEGIYKLDGENYVIIVGEYAGTRFAPETFEVTTTATTGIYKKTFTEQTFYAEFSIAGVVYTLEAGYVTSSTVGETTTYSDVKMADAVFTLIPQEGFDDGFNFKLSTYTYPTGAPVVIDEKVDLTLSDFRFTWSEAIAATEFPEFNPALQTYTNVLENVSKESVLAEIQGVINELFGTTVKFQSNGGSTVDSIPLIAGQPLTAPAAPLKDGYTFDGWYSDVELTVLYTFTTMPSEDFMLYAKWTIIPA